MPVNKINSGLITTRHTAVGEKQQPCAETQPLRNTQIVYQRKILILQ